MAVGLRRYMRGPFTRPVSEPVKTGQLVMWDVANPGYVKVADGTALCCGMATTPANPEGSAPSQADASWAQEDLAIARLPEIVVLRFAEAAAIGAELMVAPGGRVKPAPTGFTGQIVGECMGSLKAGEFVPVVANAEGDVTLRV